MKIGIDISQLSYRNTGVSNYLKHLVKGLIDTDQENEYILFTLHFAVDLISRTFRRKKRETSKELPPTNST